MEELKQYYYLVVGNVIVAVEEDNVQAVPQNAMIITDDPQIGRYQLGKAQQALQLTLFKKLGETAKVVDVIITNMVLLGHMTQTEFHAMPEGVGIQEQEKPTNIFEFTKPMNDDA